MLEVIFYDVLFLLTKLCFITVLRRQKEQSKQWTAKDEPTPKKAKVIPPDGKVMVTVFWDSYWVIFVDYLKKSETINGEYYAELLQSLNYPKWGSSIGTMSFRCRQPTFQCRNDIGFRHWIGVG